MQAELPLRPGDRIGGRLQVIREIARGGMGVLFEARDEALGRSVAVKVLLPELASTPDLVARLLREGRAAARLTSVHAAKVYEVGLLDDKVPYLVLELLEGESVEDVLARKGALDVEETLDWTVQALEAVAEAHDAGLVHRDLKPSNLFVARTPAGVVVKVLDFGIARDATDDARLTRTGDAVGTPAYMPPEQIFRSREVDARADVWATGASLYEMLSGRLPHEGSVVDMLNRIATTDAPPLLRWRADVGERLSAIVARCLARDPEQRWPSARALRDALAEELAARGGARRTSARFRATPAALAATEPAPPPGAIEERAPRSAPRASPSNRNLRIGGAALLATLAVAALGVGAAVVLRATPPPPTGAALDAAVVARPAPPPASAVAEPPIRAEPAPSASSPPPRPRPAAAPPPSAPPPPPHCECVGPASADVGLCVRFDPPYECVANGTFRLCNPSTKNGCNFRFDGPGPRCIGHSTANPGVEWEGKLVPVGCVRDYGQGRDGEACVGQYRPVDTPTVGKLRCK